MNEPTPPVTFPKTNAELADFAHARFAEGYARGKQYERERIRANIEAIPTKHVNGNSRYAFEVKRDVLAAVDAVRGTPDA